MKQFFVIFIISFCSSSLVAQDSVQTTKSSIHFDSKLRLFASQNMFLGNSVFAKEYNSKIGFGVQYYFLNVYGLHLGAGLESQYFTAKSNEDFREMEKLNFLTYEIAASYEVPLYTKWTAFPSIQFGETHLTYKSESDSDQTAKQHGFTLKFGSFFNYEFNPKLAVFLGLHYSMYYNSNLRANAENQDYFGKGNSIQLSIGLEID